MEKIDRVFIETAFVKGLLNKSDQLHERARELFPALKVATLVVTTDAVLLEVASALSSVSRIAAHEFISSCYQTANFEVVPMTGALWERGLADYRRFNDKSWTLVDCISFLVMADKGISDAATKDHHFSQAGFRELLA